MKRSFVIITAIGVLSLLAPHTGNAKVQVVTDSAKFDRMTGAPAVPIPHLIARGSPFRALQKQIDALDAKINRLIGVVRQNVTDIGTLEGNVSDVQDDVGALQDDVGTLQMNVSDLQGSEWGSHSLIQFSTEPSSMSVQQSTR